MFSLQTQLENHCENPPIQELFFFCFRFDEKPAVRQMVVLVLSDEEIVTERSGGDREHCLLLGEDLLSGMKEEQTGLLRSC